MSKQIRVTRFVPPHRRDASNYPHTETCDYSIEEASKQGFLASMVDSEHFITVEYVESSSAV